MVKTAENKIAASNLGRVKKNTYFIGFSQFVQLALGFFLFLVVARRVGDEGLGIYTFGTVMYYFIFLFNDFGIATYFTREVSRDRKLVESYFINGFALKGALILVSVAFLSIYLVLFPFSHMKMWVVILFGVYGLFYSFNQLCYATYRAFEKMEYEMTVQIIEKILIVGLGVFALYQGYGLIALAAIYGGVSLISLGINLFWTKRQFFHQKASVDFSL